MTRHYFIFECDRNNKNDQHEILFSMEYNMTNFWDVYFYNCADASYYEFLTNWAILRVDLAGHHYGNQSTHTDVISCQVSYFAHNLNNRSSYHHYYCVIVYIESC